MIRKRVGDIALAMKKRRIEIAVLAALILFAAGNRPAIPKTSVDMSSAMVAVGDFTPQRIEGVRDLGLVAVKLVISWIG